MHQTPSPRAKMLAIDVGAGQDLGNRGLIGLLMRLIETFEFKLRGVARHRKDLRNRRALRQHAGELRFRPDRRKIDAAIVETIGVDQSRDRAKWQIVAVDGMGCKQRPAWLEFDGPEAVELDRRLSISRERRIRKLCRDMKTQGSAGVA